MAIEIIEVITLQEYREAGFGIGYDDKKVKEAINTAFLQLNSVCDHNISKRWNLPDTDPLYIPEDKKKYAQEAFCLQTTWNLKNNLNMGSIGSQQESLGNWSHSYNNPKEKEVICPGVLDLLQQAGLYKSVVGKSMNVLNRQFGMPLYGPEQIEGDVADLAFVRWGEANNKFLAKYLGIEYRNLILYVDSNGYIRTKDINDFTLTEYQKITDNELLTTDKTIVGAINEIASSIPATINWDTEPTANHNKGYAVTSEGVKTYVDNKETNLQLQINELKESILTIDITPRTFENETLNSGANVFINRFNLPVDYNFKILGVVSTKARMQDDDRPLPMTITLINKENYQGYNIYIQSLIYNNSTQITDNLTINIKLLIKKI